MKRSAFFAFVFSLPIAVLVVVWVKSCNAPRAYESSVDFRYCLVLKRNGAAVGISRILMDDSDVIKTMLVECAPSNALDAVVKEYRGRYPESTISDGELGELVSRSVIKKPDFRGGRNYFSICVRARSKNLADEISCLYFLFVQQWCEQQYRERVKYACEHIQKIRLRQKVVQEEIQRKLGAISDLAEKSV